MKKQAQKKIDISPTMRDALRMALDKGQKNLYRWPGGYWTYHKQGSGLVAPGLDNEYHGTSTIQALLDRGLFEVAESRTGRNGTFPIQVRLTHAAFEALK